MKGDTSEVDVPQLIIFLQNKKNPHLQDLTSWGRENMLRGTTPVYHHVTIMTFLSTSKFSVYTLAQ